MKLLKGDYKLTIENNQMSDYEDVKLNTRTILICLWTALMLLYIYCDMITFFKPNQINEIIDGFMGPFLVNQISLAVTGVLLAIPAIIIVANLFIKMVAIKWINIIGEILFILVTIGNMAGEKWAYYIIYGILELIITVLIIIRSIKWRKKAK
jgi:hypothetical protein